MANPRQVGPYQSIREAVMALIDRGVPWREAARVVNAELGRAPEDRRVYSYTSGLRHRSASARPVAISLRVPARIFGGLSARAADRGMSPAALAHQLIAVAVTDDMIDAILDDGGEA